MGSYLYICIIKKNQPETHNDLWLAVIWRNSVKVPQSSKTAVGALADNYMIQNLDL